MFCPSKRGRKNLQSNLHVASNIHTNHPFLKTKTLCSTCSPFNIPTSSTMASEKTTQSPAVDILHKSNQSGLCTFVAIIIRNALNPGKQSSMDIGITGITRVSYTRACGYAHIPDDISSVLRDICHRLYMQTPDRPRDVTSAMIATQSNLLLDIHINLPWA
ncbi:uncharacterized protein EDB91DRAFT_894056 [Suillus paluster]|uniref:uncharacterized protein n=1 Tax=Suillus paluster TaxID=48578 RepID=UPI001B87EFC2|nr:uncharacterized protein EDB91DRAFT_894056 [Suillus paluster]KAG1727276.1 hypothetical protein EDB91DRAFT_894056 [Suillus paluster]